MKTLTIIFVVGVLVSSSLTGQNRMNITQYMLHQPIINMASIASNNNINAAVLHRQQWVGFEGAPASTFLSFNSPIKSTNLHIGGIASSDRIGSYAMTKVDLGIAYRMKIKTNNYLSLALKGGVTNTSADYSGLTLGNQNDPEFNVGSNSEFQPDFSFSTYYFADKFYAGLAIPSLFRNESLYPESELVVPEDFHYFLTAGYQFTLNKTFKLGFSTLLKGVQGAPLQADLNTQLLYNDFLGLGFSYRTSQDLAAIFSIKLFEKLTFSYSYDFGISDMSRFHSNTHEFMLIFDTPTRDLIPITSPRF